MNRCIELALRGAGHTAPNPMVGSVLVQSDRIIGEGYHRRYGGPHAEVNCINSVAEKDRALIASSTLYVSLEPCSHFGKTPPCTDLILEKEIPRVVIGCTDPFPEVNGRGISILEKAGVEVTTGILLNECLEVNRRFIHVIEKKLPYIILKWAQTGNGKIAAEPGERLLISNNLTNRLVHKWRTEEAAILVGTNTALLDDPALNGRHWIGPSPLRLVIDRSLRLPATLNLFDGTYPTIVFTSIDRQTSKNLEYVNVGTEVNLLPQIIQWLATTRVQSVLVEGGAATLQAFIDLDYWDEARIITNQQLLISPGVEAPTLRHGQLLHQEQLAGDSIHYYKRLNS